MDAHHYGLLSNLCSIPFFLPILFVLDGSLLNRLLCFQLSFHTRWWSCNGALETFVHMVLVLKNPVKQVRLLMACQFCFDKQC